MRKLNSAIVLGGAGFLGSWLVDALREQGVATTVVDDLSTGRSDQARNADLVVADVAQTDLAHLVRVKAADAVFHLAGSAYVPPSIDRPIDDLRHNVMTTLSVLEALRSVTGPPVFVFASSAAVYGDGHYLPMDESHPVEPMSPYGASKLACEQYARLYSQLHKIQVLSARLFSLYGPRQRKQVVYDLIERALADGEELTVLGCPQVTRDLVFAADAARALITLARKAPAHGEAYNIASGRQTCLQELVGCVLSATGAQKSVRFTGHVRPGDPMHWEGDPRRAAALGVVCSTPLEVGIGATAQWVMSEDGHGC